MSIFKKIYMFLTGQTDYNNNKKPDNVEVYLVMQSLMRQIEEFQEDIKDISSRRI